MTLDLSRFEKLYRIDLTDIIKVKRIVIVARDEDLGILVADCPERSEFPLGIGEFVSGDFDVAGKIDSVEEVRSSNRYFRR